MEWLSKTIFGTFTVIAIIFVVASVIVYPIMILVYLGCVVLAFGMQHLFNHIPLPKKSERRPLVHLRIPRVNRSRGILFMTLPDSHSMCKIFQPGVKETDWKACEIEVLPTYAALFTGSWMLRTPSMFKKLNAAGARKQPLRSRLRRPTLTFNPANMMWIGHLQHIDEQISEICLDLDTDGIWSTVWVRMLRHDARDFAAVLDRIAPDALQAKRNRLHPNIRYMPVQAHQIGLEGDGRQSDKPVELYLTPLYLVVLVNTFVSRTIPVDSIDSFNITVSPDLPDDWRRLEFVTGSGTINYAIPYSPELEQRLIQAVRRDRPPSKTQTATHL
jgi:hypothetical protein